MDTRLALWREHTSRGPAAMLTDRDTGEFVALLRLWRTDRGFVWTVEIGYQHGNPQLLSVHATLLQAVNAATDYYFPH